MRAKSMLYQQNTVKLHGGKITLYRRSDENRSSWHYRFRFDQRDIRKSAKTTDLDEAKAIANDHFHECRVKLKEGLPIFDFLLKDVAKEFLKGFNHKNITPQKRKHRKAFYKGMLKYWVELYGDKTINRISQKDITEYLPWRLSYWTEGPGTHRKRPPQAKDTPSNTTLEFEHNALGAVFKFALSKGYVAHHQIPSTKYEGAGRRGTRPAFTLKEFLHLGRAALKWTKEAKGKPYFWKRWMTSQYVLIMVLSGLRVGEARWLKWRDLEPIRDEKGRRNYLIWVGDEEHPGKRGFRKTVPVAACCYWLDNLRKFRRWAKENDDYVFAKKDGSPYRDFSRGFNSLLRYAKLLTDRHGRKFTVYSLRHTYFTFQIFHGDGASLIEVAKNGGTSVKQLEDTYVKTDSRQGATRLGGLYDKRPTKRKKTRRKPAKVIPYPGTRENA